MADLLDSTNPPNGDTVAAAKDNVVSSEFNDRLPSFTDIDKDAASAVDTIDSYPAVQSVKDTVTDGPIAEKVKDHAVKTESDFKGLADSRVPPPQSAADGQLLTHYHSLFYSLLSWEHPRATGVTFGGLVLFIFAARYLPILRWLMKGFYMTFGLTAALEIAGKIVMSQGIVSSIRPRRYYRIPKEVLERTLDDVEQLVNFFVIEFQRVFFVENVMHTLLAFSASIVTYFLIKFTPLWGLALIGTTVTFLAPLIYIENRELIDTHINNAHEVINQQVGQVRELAGQQTSKAAGSFKQYAGDYSSKAQEYIGSKRGSSPTMTKKPEDFPKAPTHDPVGEKVNGADPMPAS